MNTFVEGRQMKSVVVRLIREEAGQDLIEYALIAGLISVVAVAAITATGTSIGGVWTKVQGAAATAAAALP
jgi:pilus assembly protein Flp/PilA